MKRNRKTWLSLSKQDWSYAVNLIETVAWLAGEPDYLDELRETIVQDRILDRVRGRQASSAIYEWLAAAANYQGISDAVARNYMAEHGTPRWRTINRNVESAPCPLLRNYWTFHGCRYRKATYTCANPHLIDSCCVPNHEFRNGNLNQLAYSLFLFIRDVADGDLIDWIDQRLADPVLNSDPRRLEHLAAALIEPLAGVHGLSHKVLSMALGDLLVVGTHRNPIWGEVGGSLIAIDTLVHNFLVRTGILHRAGAEHLYGPQCYGPHGCKILLSELSAAIDARQFNPNFPASFPRYVQRAIWAFCAIERLNVCNGRKINDNGRCANKTCRIFGLCDRRRLRKPKSEKPVKSVFLHA